MSQVDEEQVRRNAYRDRLEQHRHINGDGSWWENDAHGIPLCRVCEECAEAKLSVYRPEILSGYEQNDVDELIDGEWVEIDEVRS